MDSVLVGYGVRQHDPLTNTDQDKAALRSLVELKDVPMTGATDLYFGRNAPAGNDRMEYWRRPQRSKVSI